MQSLGFAYAMAPVLRRLYPDAALRASRLNLHMEYFNTQPYLASFILGAAARLEEERVSGRNAAADVSGLKTTLAAPLGALGDSFFWGGLKPLAAVVAAALLLAGAWWAPLLFLLFYNIVHVGLRAGLLFLGYKSGGEAGAFTARYDFSRITRLFKTISLCVIGGILGMASRWIPEFSLPGNFPGSLRVAAALLITVILVAILRRGGSPIKLMLGLAAACLALAFLGVV